MRAPLDFALAVLVATLATAVHGALELCAGLNVDDLKWVYYGAMTLPLLRATDYRLLPVHEMLLERVAPFSDEHDKMMHEFCWLSASNCGSSLTLTAIDANAESLPAWMIERAESPHDVFTGRNFTQLLRELDLELLGLRHPLSIMRAIRLAMRAQQYDRGVFLAHFSDFVEIDASESITSMPIVEWLELSASIVRTAGHGDDYDYDHLFSFLELDSDDTETAAEAALAKSNDAMLVSRGFFPFCGIKFRQKSADRLLPLKFDALKMQFKRKIFYGQQRAMLKRIVSFFRAGGSIKPAEIELYESLVSTIKIDLRVQLRRLNELMSGHPRLPLMLTKNERALLAHPLPLLFASTKRPSSSPHFQSHTLITHQPLRLGTDIDVLLTTRNHCEHVDDWLMTNGLIDQVTSMYWRTDGSIMPCPKLLVYDAPPTGLKRLFHPCFPQY